jgi:hypothetical protein
MAFADTSVARFVASPAGRIVRVVAGLLLIYAGLLMGTAVGWGVVAIGLVPLSAGLLDLCYLSALLGGPIRGKQIRGPVTSEP